MAVPAINSARDLIEAGKQAYVKGKYDKAQRIFASAIKTSKCNDSDLLKLLDHQIGALLKLKRFDESLNCAKSMIRHSRTDGRGYIRCGKLESLQGNYEAALKWYQHGLKNVPPKDPLHATLKAKVESIQVVIRRELYRTKLRDPLVSLPLEVAQLIASYLDFRTLVMVMRVSRSWKAFVTNLPILSDTLDFSGAQQQVQIKAYRAALRRLKTTPRKVTVFNFSRPASVSVAESLGVWLKAGSLNHLEVFDLHCMHELTSTTKLFTLVGRVDTDSISPNLKSVVFGPEARLELHGMIALLTRCTKLVHARFGSVAAVPRFSGDPWPPGYQQPFLKHLEYRMGAVDASERPSYFETRFFRPFHNLETLRCSSINLVASEASGPADLRQLPLRFVELSKCAYLDLSELPSTLAELDLSASTCAVSFPEAPTFPALHRLSLFSHLLCNSLLEQLLSNATNVAHLHTLHLDLDAVEGVRAPSLHDISPCSQVRHLRLRFQHLRDSMVDDFMYRFPTLETLRLEAAQISGVFLAALLRRKDSKLKYICLQDCYYVSADVADLASIAGVVLELKTTQETHQGRRIRITQLF